MYYNQYLYIYLIKIENYFILIIVNIYNIKMTKTKTSTSKTKKVSFEINVKDNKNLEFEKVISFLEKEIDDSYKKYLDSSVNSVIESDCDYIK